jgi:hypothetical protein
VGSRLPTAAMKSFPRCPMTFKKGRGQVSRPVLSRHIGPPARDGVGKLAVPVSVGNLFPAYDGLQKFRVRPSMNLRLVSASIRSCISCAKEELVKFGIG